MSDLEEPPTKVSKVELGPASLDSMEDMEGQEEWLSEGVLTDEDYLQSQDQSYSTMDSHDETNPETNQNSDRLTIEQTLNDFENSKATDDHENTDLDAFLIRKTDGKVIGGTIREKEKEKVKEEDDGHDTDELLRVLGEGDEKVKKKKILKTIQRKKVSKKNETDEEDDMNLFQAEKITRLKVSRALAKKVTLAEPENFESETDMSSDEVTIVKKTLTVKELKKKMEGKSSLAPSASTSNKAINSSSISSTFRKDNPPHSTPLKTYTNPNKHKPALLKMKPVKEEQMSTTVEEKQQTKQVAEEQPSMEAQEMMEEDFLDDEEFDVSEDIGSESESLDLKEEKLDIKKPEEMDEEVPSDEQSPSEDDSLNDDFPSSDSELEDWFTLDIRNERATEYIPLLGSKAHQLLTEEKERVKAKIKSLKENVNVLTKSARDQALEIRKANKTLDELDAMLAAA